MLNHGFSILELLFALAISGLLAVIAGPLSASIADRARIGEVIANTGMSPGVDGDKRPPLSAWPSRDDIVRAADGSFVGSAIEI